MIFTEETVSNFLNYVKSEKTQEKNKNIFSEALVNS